MANETYYGDWNSILEMCRDFEIEVESLCDVNILFAVYTYECYEGFAFVLFEKDGILYEVNASHCSCYGLEGQWEPEETFIEFIRKKLDAGGFDYELGEDKNKLKEKLAQFSNKEIK